jgi:hypothetical protein
MDVVKMSFTNNPGNIRVCRRMISGLASNMRYNIDEIEELLFATTIACILIEFSNSIDVKIEMSKPLNFEFKAVGSNCAVKTDNALEMLYIRYLEKIVREFKIVRKKDNTIKVVSFYM